eukprot:1800142-Pyramimonas_sp.AAC.1
MRRSANSLARSPGNATGCSRSANQPGGLFVLREGAIADPVPQQLFARSARRAPGPLASSGGGTMDWANRQIKLRSERCPAIVF